MRVRRQRSERDGGAAHDQNSAREDALQHRRTRRDDPRLLLHQLTPRGGRRSFESLTPALTAPYGCDLAEEAARVAAGDVEPLPPE